jgi:hypothetical protein
VPSLYAATSLAAAAHETLFHDVRPEDAFKTVPLSHARSRAHSRLVVRRELRLTPLFRPDLMAWRLDRAAFFRATEAHYGICRAWAATVHASFPNSQGLVWSSVRADPDRAVLLFGDRVPRSALALVTTRRADRDPDLLEELRHIARRSDITLTR